MKEDENGIGIAQEEKRGTGQTSRIMRIAADHVSIFDLSHPSPAKVNGLIKRVIAECDYYVSILGGRYRSVGPEGIGYTEMQYRFPSNSLKG